MCGTMFLQLLVANQLFHQFGGSQQWFFFRQFSIAIESDRTLWRSPKMDFLPPFWLCSSTIWWIMLCSLSAHMWSTTLPTTTDRFLMPPNGWTPGIIHSDTFEIYRFSHTFWCYQLGAQEKLKIGKVSWVLCLLSANTLLYRFVSLANPSVSIKQHLPVTLRF